MSYESDLKAFVIKVRQRYGIVATETADAVFESIVEGSEITGAPGQPVDKNVLKPSWKIKTFSAINSQYDWEISTPVIYAGEIEEGIGPYGPMQLRSTVGGFHSVKLTRAGFKKIVAMKLAIAKTEQFAAFVPSNDLSLRLEGLE